MNDDGFWENVYDGRAAPEYYETGLQCLKNTVADMERECFKTRLLIASHRKNGISTYLNHYVQYLTDIVRVFRQN